MSPKIPKNYHCMSEQNSNSYGTFSSCLQSELGFTHLGPYKASPMRQGSCGQFIPGSGPMSQKTSVWSLLPSATVYVCVCACVRSVCVCVYAGPGVFSHQQQCMCVCVCVRACVHSVCVCARPGVFSHQQQCGCVCGCVGLF